MDCRDASRFVALRVDGEIDDIDCQELERHLENCRFCQQRWEAERYAQECVREKLQAHFEKPENHAPLALRARIQSEGRRHRAKQRRPLVLGVPVAACAALALVTVIVPEPLGVSGKTSDLLDDSVRRHSANLPPEFRVKDKSHRELENYLRQHLRYRVRIPPPRNTGLGPQLVGARLSNVNDRDVAYLMFDHRGARMSLFAYPRGEGVSQTQGRRGLTRLPHGIYVGKERGYSVVSWAEGSGDFALISDLAVEELLRWAPHFRQPKGQPKALPPRMPKRPESMIQTVSHQP